MKHIKYLLCSLMLICFLSCDDDVEITGKSSEWADAYPIAKELITKSANKEYKFAGGKVRAIVYVWSSLEEYGEKIYFQISYANDKFVPVSNLFTDGTWDEYGNEYDDNVKFDGRRCQVIFPPEKCRYGVAEYLSGAWKNEE